MAGCSSFAEAGAGGAKAGVTRIANMEHGNCSWRTTYAESTAPSANCAESSFAPRVIAAFPANKASVEPSGNPSFSNTASCNNAAGPEVMVSKGMSKASRCRMASEMSNWTFSTQPSVKPSARNVSPTSSPAKHLCTGAANESSIPATGKPHTAWIDQRRSPKRISGSKFIVRLLAPGTTLGNCKVRAHGPLGLLWSMPSRRRNTSAPPEPK
mmetsp:Transcript_123609/g.357515  ORF Transcript_123609/g.357515 Transcript_123609/m.357515 type:complete len:212 (+) Transcript_123609:1505-2140(+)